MKYLLVAVLGGLALGLSSPGFAQQTQPAPATKPAPAAKAAEAPKTNPQQERMKACNEKAGDKKGDERKAFMKTCLAGEDDKALTAQQQKMKDCNAQAGSMKGDERKAFMSKCLKGA